MAIPENWRELYAAHARGEAKRLDSFGRKIGRCVAASRFHTRADNLRTAATILDGENPNLAHHVENAIQIIEQGGRA
jgi:hypothetical protein